MCALVFGSTFAGSVFSADKDKEEVAPVPVGEISTSVLLKDAQEFLEDGLLDQAVPYLEEILVRLEGVQEASAAESRAFCMTQLGMCYLETQQYQKAADILRQFVKDYPDHESARMAKFLILDALAWQDDFRPLKEYVQQLEESGELAEILAMINDPANADLSRHAVLSLASAYARSADIDNLKRYLAYCDEASRSDIGLNLALIAGGDTAFENDDPIRALQLYRLVKTREELKASYASRLAALKAELEQPLPWVELSKRSAQQAHRDAEQNRYSRMLAEQQQIDKQNYDLDLMVRMAQCFDAMARRWPAYYLYRQVFADSPDSPQAELCHYSAFYDLTVLKETEAAKEEGLTYVDLYPSGRYHDEVTLGLMRLYLALDEIDDADLLGYSLKEQVPMHRYLDQVNYLLGYIRFQQQCYEEALELFRETAEKWPNRVYAEESTYWVGMCHLFLSQFAEAIAVFEGYLTNPAWEKKEFAEDVTYRLGMARYGLGDFSASEETFRSFLAQFPDSKLYSEACSMLGDLRGAEGDMDEALDFYARARESAVTREQEDYAVFQTAQVYELLKRYSDIISLMDGYLAKNGSEGNFAKASLWMAKAWKAQGQDEKALNICCETISKYGNDPQVDSVDMIFEQLLKDANESAEAAGRIKARLAKDLTVACQDEKTRTLCLRLSTFFAAISTGDERSKYVQTVLDEKDMSVFSPLPLMLLAEESAAAGQTNRVKQAYEYFMQTFALSGQRLKMANIQIQSLIDTGAYADALALARSSMEQCGGYEGEGRTQKLAGDALRLMKEYDQAIEMYNEFLAVREWRGPLTPEVLYWIGVCRYDQNRIEEAFAYFQRVYVLYESYPKWTAKAYESSINCLRRLGREDEVVKTWQEMVANPAVLETPEGRRAEAELGKLPSKEERR